METIAKSFMTSGWTSETAGVTTSFSVAEMKATGMTGITESFADVGESQRDARDE